MGTGSSFTCCRGNVCSKTTKVGVSVYARGGTIGDTRTVWRRVMVPIDANLADFFQLVQTKFRQPCLPRSITLHGNQLTLFALQRAMQSNEALHVDAVFGALTGHP